MASIEDAFVPILSGVSADRSGYTVLGVLVGRVVNAAYYIYRDTSGEIFTEADGKKIKLDISYADNGMDIKVPLIGYTYRVKFYESPCVQK